MQAQHIVILIGLVIGFALLSFFITKAIKGALRRAYAVGKSAGVADSSARLEALNSDLANLARRRERERRGFLETIELKNLTINGYQQRLCETVNGSLTKADLQVLLDTATTLGLAHKTWTPIKGTEPWRQRAATQLEQLNGIAHRILGEIRTTDTPATKATTAVIPGEAA